MYAKSISYYLLVIWLKFDVRGPAAFDLHETVEINEMTFTQSKSSDIFFYYFFFLYIKLAYFLLCFWGGELGRGVDVLEGGGVLSP